MFQKLPEGPEMEVFKEKKKEYEKEIQNIVASVTGGSNVDPIQIDVEDVTVEEMLEEVVKSTESMYALKSDLLTMKKSLKAPNSTLISQSICVFTQINYPQKQLELNR